MANNERMFQEVLERTKREAEERQAREEAAQLQRVTNISKREAEAMQAREEAAQLQRVINQSKREAGEKVNTTARKILEETGAKYKEEALQTALQFLDGNTNQLRRNAIVLQMETDAIFQASPYDSNNTKAIKDVKTFLKGLQDRLSRITSGEEELDVHFITSLPLLLRKEVYEPLGLVRKDVLEKDKSYQIVKAARDKMDIANAAERNEAERAREREVTDRAERVKREEIRATLEAAEEKVASAKSTMNSNKARLNKVGTNPKLKEAYDKSVVAYEKALEEFKSIYSPKGGRRTRKYTKSKKAKKTRSHR